MYIQSNRILFPVMILFYVIQSGCTIDIPQWTLFETSLQSDQTYDNPLQDIRLTVDFTSPSGKTRTGAGFWDGETTWRIRFSPDEQGPWTYRLHCSDESNSSLNGQRGDFHCSPYQGDNPLYLHGAIRISQNRRFLEHADGTPFFWLADTVWNGPLLADRFAWQNFLQNRKEKGFNAIQFVLTPWRAADSDPQGQVAYTGQEKIQIQPAFFQRMDARIRAINEEQIIAVPVLLWAIQGQENPGFHLPIDQRIRLAEYLVARYEAFQVIWFLAGDGDYRGEKSEDWKTIGRAVFKDNTTRLVTLHPGGQHWIREEFCREPWFHFLGYQSGHGDDDKTFQWLYAGPPSQDWRKEPPLPFINLEPNYEAHNGYTSRKVHDDHAVRRAAYWSLLIAPPAGVTYGAHGIWGWHTSVQKPLRHENTGFGAPWHIAMNLPGSQQMKYLKNFFTSIDWWRLQPAQDLLLEQPGNADAKSFITAGKTPEGDVMVIYLPEGGEVKLNTESLQKPASAMWFHPTTGGQLNAGDISQLEQTFAAPDRNDWILYIRSQ